MEIDKEKQKRKVFKSSVVLIPPEDCCVQIQAIRQQHDKHFKRWMPHINLLYPFLEDDKEGSNFTEAAERLTAGLRDVKPFTVKMTKDSFGYFEHKSFSTLWLKPLEENPVKQEDVDTGGDSGGGGDGHSGDGSEHQLVGKQPLEMLQKTDTEDGEGRSLKEPEVDEPAAIGAGAVAGTLTKDKPAKSGETDADASNGKHSILANKRMDDVSAKTSQMDIPDDSISGTLGALAKAADDKAGHKGIQLAFGKDLFDQDDARKPTNSNGSKKSRQEKKKERKQRQKEDANKRRKDAALGSNGFRHHPDVLSLQSKLEELYPYCNDLGSISPAGFQPHLSLGQFQCKGVAEFMEDFRAEWVDVEYRVSEVFLISREDFDDPFHVRHRVQLGGV